MTATTIRVQMAQRKDTAANWTAANPILLSGEIGYETDTKKLKIGDGTTNWNSLAYLPIPDGSGNLTITGNLEIGSTGSLTFEGTSADGFETTLAVTNPTADRTITLPNQSGTVVVSGNASIVDADIAANAEIAVSKLANGTARQLLQTDAAGTGVEWTSNVDIPGTLDVTGAARIGATTGDATLKIGTGASANRNAYIDLVGDTTYTNYGTRIIRQDGGANADSRIQHRGTGALALETAEAGASIVFLQQPGERARIDSSGRLLVGTSSSFAVGTIESTVQVQSAAGLLSLYRYGGASADAPAVLNLGRSRGTTPRSVTAVADGDRLGSIVFNGANGTDASNFAAWITCEVDGEPFTGVDTTDLPGRLVFSTTADGASSPTERMRIKNNGTINFSNVAVYADNAAAIAAGLVSGDVYRKADGTLMITF